MSPLERYITFFEAVPRREFGDLDRFVTDDVRFVDPFNDVHGITAFREILNDMCEQVGQLEIIVFESAMTTAAGDSKHPGTTHALMRWRLSGLLHAFKNRPWKVTGCSAVRFAADGRVEEHIDYWDAAGQLYENVPILGALLRFLRRRIALEAGRY